MQQLKKTGKIVCKTKEELCTMRFVIYPNGWAKLTLKENNNPIVVLKKQFIGNYKNGEIGLAGGNIKQRHAYFKNDEFLEYLNEHNITGIIKCNPNKRYKLIDRNYPSDTIKEQILTDGNVKYIKESHLEEENEDGLYDIRLSYTVSNATWVIICRNNTLNYLYTLKGNIRNLNIP